MGEINIYTKLSNQYLLETLPHQEENILNYYYFSPIQEWTNKL